MRSLRHDFAARDMQGRVLLVLDNGRRGQFLDAGIESVRRVVPVPAADCRWIGRRGGLWRRVDRVRTAASSAPNNYVFDHHDYDDNDDHGRALRDQRVLHVAVQWL